jgi:hypothetical protein
MGWLGEPLGEEHQIDATPFIHRSIKDLIEEHLFALHRDLFSSIGLVFFDTTSLYFEGQGGETVGHYGHSKDHRPDLHQMVVGVILDENGNPLCSELWPGTPSPTSPRSFPLRRGLKTSSASKRSALSLTGE